MYEQCARSHRGWAYDLWTFRRFAANRPTLRARLRAPHFLQTVGLPSTSVHFGLALAAFSRTRSMSPAQGVYLPSLSLHSRLSASSVLESFSFAFIFFFSASVQGRGPFFETPQNISGSFFFAVCARASSFFAAQPARQLF